MKKRYTLLSMALALASFTGVHAQLSQNSCKFLGNITTSYNWQEYADAQESSEKYHELWNQITAENGSKWGSIHTARGQFNWTNSDRAYNYAKEHGFPFKFHCLIWGSQYPSWIKNLSAEETYEVIVEWMDAVKEHYPDLELIDVVNEAIYAGDGYHSPYQETKIIEALGGKGRTGYDWIIKAFHMARERWPNAKLIYNDYNTFRWQKNEFIELVRALIDGGAPIDAYGAQSHDLTDMEFDEFKRAMDETQQKLGIPMYITEYDIGTSDDALQLQRYKEQIPYMWEAEYVAGVTLWGWIYGKTWTTDGNSGLIKNGQDRPAMKWLREYMATDAAKNAKGPFCGGGSATIQLSASTIQLSDSIKISVTAKMKDDIDHIDMFADDELLVHKYIAPYEWYYTPSTTGTHTIKIVAFDKQGNEIEKTAELFVCAARAPYNGEPIAIPGTVEVEEFDKGCDGIAFHDSDNENEGDVKIQEGGVDIVTGGDNYAIGHTASDEWLEYTVNVEKSDEYKLSAFVSSGAEGSGFKLDMDGKTLVEKVEVPKTGDKWDVYEEIELGKFNLTEGEHILRMTITNPYCNIDKLVFSKGGSSSDEPADNPSEEPADDAPDLSSMFSGVSLTKGPKGLEDHNTLISHRFGADPYAMVYNDEVYVYMTNDQQQFDNTNGDTNGYGEINTINCISSKDMVNWTDHGSMNIAGRNNSAGVAKWASCSWAPSAMHAKVNGKDKFFLYFANNGSGIGVVTSDTPFGPWVDPLGKELISRNTPNCGNVTWLFDPAVLMDDDGKAYLYFGGGVPDGKQADPGTARVVQLGSDYISIVGTPTTINPPYLFEDAGANKIGGKYIYSYCSNWNCVGNPMNNAEICYMTSDDPLGPFTYSGMVFKNHSAFFKNSGGNNHHAIFEFKGEYYIAYHALVLQNAMGLPDKGYRSTNIDKIPVDVATGKISQATGTLAGVPQVCSHNPFVRTQGETMAWQGGINTRFGGDGMLLTSIDKGDWIGLSQVDFGSGASRFTACVSSNKTGAIKICLDEPDGEVVGYLEVPNTNGQLVEVSSKMLKSIKGEHHLFFVFTGGFELDYWVFDGSNANCTISATTISMGDSISIKATASMEAEIDHIDMFANDSLLVHKYIAPYNWNFTPLEEGEYTIKIVAYDKNGNVASDSTNLFVCAAQAPYSQNKIPGIIEAEEFDFGCEGFSYHDSDPQNEEGELRDDVSVDITVGNNGYAIGYTMEGEWMNYTVDVAETATYKLTATVASGIENSAFQLYVDGVKAVSEIIVPQTGTDVWDVYKEVKCDEIDLKAGKHVLRIEITSPYCNIDKLSFKSKSGTTGIVENGAIAGLSGKCDAFTPLGIYVKSFEIENGDVSPIHDQLTEGIYLLRFENGKGLLIQVRK